MAAEVIQTIYVDRSEGGRSQVRLRSDESAYHLHDLFQGHTLRVQVRRTKNEFVAEDLRKIFYAAATPGAVTQDLPKALEPPPRRTVVAKVPRSRWSVYLIR